MVRRLNDERPELEYPCRWGYTIIGIHAGALHDLAARVLAGRDYTLRPSHRSSSGKYVSLAIELEVRDEEDRVGIFEALKADGAVTFVL